jgi:hypothetical protein
VKVVLGVRFSGGDSFHQKKPNREAGMPSNEHTAIGTISDITKSLERVEAGSPSLSVALPSLSPGTHITVHTRNTCYRMEVMDGSARRVMISGGLLFPQGDEVEVIGATDDEGVRVGWIVEGFQIELSTARGPVLTSIVESLSVRQREG